MADQNVSQLRNDGNKDSSKSDDPKDSFGTDSEAGPPPHEAEGVPASTSTSSEGTPETPSEEIDPADMEILDCAKTGSNYRRAAAVYDPDETNIQLCEHYQFEDADYRAHGHF